MIIQIKNRFSGEVIHTFESENATIKEAVLDAIKKGASSIFGSARLGLTLKAKRQLRPCWNLRVGYPLRSIHTIDTIVLSMWYNLIRQHRAGIPVEMPHTLLHVDYARQGRRYDAL